MNSVSILFSGDSITDCGRSRDNDEYFGCGYVTLIAARLLSNHPGQAIKIYNRGIGGDRVVDLYARWKKDVINLRPDVLSILIGINDTWHRFLFDNGVEPERYHEFYQKLIDWTKHELPATKIMLLEPFTLKTGAVNDGWTAEIAERRQIVKMLVQDNKLIFVELQNMIKNAAAQAGDPAKILNDGVHPTLAGHQMIADKWLEVAEETGLHHFIEGP